MSETCSCTSTCRHGDGPGHNCLQTWCSALPNCSPGLHTVPLRTARCWTATSCPPCEGLSSRTPNPARLQQAHVIRTSTARRCDSTQVQAARRSNLAGQPHGQHRPEFPRNVTLEKKTPSLLTALTAPPCPEARLSFSSEFCNLSHCLYEIQHEVEQISCSLVCRAKTLEGRLVRTVTLSCVLMPKADPACSATSNAPPSLPLLSLTTTPSSTKVPASALAPPPPRPALRNHLSINIFASIAFPTEDLS